jgi:hypothetical protein
VLQICKNNIVFARGANRQYESQFAVTGAKIGTQLQIRKPVKYAVRSGAALDAQDYVEEYALLTVDQQKHCDVQFTSVEMTMSLDDFTRRIAEPQAIKLANEIDKDGLAHYWEVANSIMSPDTTVDPDSHWFAYAQALAMLADESAPMDDRFYICLDQWEQARVINENKGLFQSSEQISAQYKKGMMGTSAGFEWSFDQNVATHTTGPRGGTPVTGAAGQTGSSLAVTGFTAAAANRLKKGDVFTITGVYAVNPLNLTSTGRLRQFTVTADVDSLAAGTATIPISPPIVVAPDARATVNAAPGAAAPLTFVGTANTPYKQNMAYHSTAFTMASVDLMMPYTGMASRVSDPDAGFSFRMWKSSDINSDAHPSRLDTLYGWAVPRPEWAVRVWSAMT